jgi:hypothetical protein
MAKGCEDYKKFKAGKVLSPMKSIYAMCYMCNGEGEDGFTDCKGSKSCPLYPYSVWGRGKR